MLTNKIHHKLELNDKINIFTFQMDHQVLGQGQGELVLEYLGQLIQIWNQLY